MGEEGASRRPIASRSSSWAIAMSAWLARIGVTPNSISSHWLLILTSAIIAAGSLVICVTRTITLARSLERL
ncbi:hypothetical protein PYR71_08580 [Rhizobium sp. MC63]|uniref:Uncharacterized protein n=1 Tax=Rhizobium lentis TaxID=1138194 RepID=A0A7W8UPG9_9HYPH|nr:MULTISPECIES: hypothetical protein [Rhizobium]MBB4574792.1 hypothetical protein [Rhizobium lentis]MBB5550719.1 hypothetical protein [Rhizobium lentis]MBB5561159.1 hypothetical protein [Rhizobium lentis]MBB5567838.1 hypothetical protein [Rhizobium lentis]MDF0696567.1 hypothetical protein [Rhizobium sp. MC63]